MNDARKKALGVINYRAANLDMMAQFANGHGTLLGEDTDTVAHAFTEAARVLREAIRMIEESEENKQ